MRTGTDPIKVLLVDDDPFCRALLEKALSKHGFEILAADNGRQAFDVIRQQGPSLVITDVIMPEMDGLELCRLIRASAEVAFAYVIILSGRTDREDITKGFDAGADDYIVKPLDQNDLFARLKSAERIIRLEAFYREHTLHLHKVNAEVAVMNGRLERLTLELECARKDAETKTEVVKSFLADTSHEIHGHLLKKANVASVMPASADFVVSTLAGEADMAELIEMFVKELPHRMSAMREAMDQHDLENLQRLAHQLKGSAGGYGFQVITDAAKQLERSVKTSQDLDNIRREINLLAGLCERARATPTST